MSNFQEKLTKKLNNRITKINNRFDPHSKLYLLKRQPHSNLFAVVKQLNKGWFVKFNSFREQYLFRFATTDSDFESEFTEASFIAYGVPDVNDKVEVYEIPDNQRDKIHPNGSSPFWQAFAVKMENERFGIFDRKAAGDSFPTFNGSFLTFNGERLKFTV